MKPPGQKNSGQNPAALGHTPEIALAFGGRRFLLKHKFRPKSCGAGQDSFRARQFSCGARWKRLFLGKDAWGETPCAPLHDQIQVCTLPKLCLQSEFAGRPNLQLFSSTQKFVLRALQTLVVFEQGCMERDPMCPAARSN